MHEQRKEHRWQTLGLPTRPESVCDPSRLNRSVAFSQLRRLKHREDGTQVEDGLGRDGGRARRVFYKKEGGGCRRGLASSSSVTSSPWSGMLRTYRHPCRLCGAGRCRGRCRGCRGCGESRRGGGTEERRGRLRPPFALAVAGPGAGPAHKHSQIGAAPAVSVRGSPPALELFEVLCCYFCAHF